MTTYVPVTTPARERSRLWWLRYWRLAVLVVALPVVAWQAAEAGLGWRHVLPVTAVSAVLLAAVLVAR